jgi:hypothetical protein
MASIIKANQLQDFGGNSIMTSDGAGNLTLNNAAMKNTPAWSAEGQGLTVANNTWTELVFTTENFDTDSAYSTSTGRFTVPTGRAGIYHFDYSFGISGNPDDGEKVNVRLYKNGSAISLSIATAYNSLDGQTSSVRGSYMLDLADGDYVSAYGNHNEGSSTSDATGSFLGNKLV